MKKSILALSIAAAIGGLGFAGGALAITTADVTGAVADDLNFTNTGIGHSLLVPYYTAQTQHATLINIVNSDTLNGKAVKVRFRGASNSDDVYDFQLFLSPGDVWAANISQDTATGLAKLTTIDKSCTKPANVNGTFVTARLKSSWTAAVKAQNTREGYVEIFNMADVPPGTALFTAIKHVSGVPPCSGSAWTYLDTDRSYGGYIENGLANPTAGLFGNWTIINVNNASAWGAAIPALLASAPVQSTPPSRTPSTGRIVYFPQTPVAEASPALFTADPLMAPASGTAVLAAMLYDLPDMSTPYLTFAVTPTPHEQAMQLSASIAATTVANEYLTDPSINATTDWVFSMPTRRYSVAMDYASGTRVFNNSAPTYFTPDSTTVVGDQICVKNVTTKVWDREENSPLAPSDVVISPNTPTASVVFCGETSILTVNNPGATQSGVLNGTVAVKDIQTSTYKDGWIRLYTPGATGVGLPILGGAFVRATSGASTFGANWDHHYIRPVFTANPTL